MSFRGFAVPSESVAGVAPLFVSGVRDKEDWMKQASEFTKEVNRTTPIEKTITVIVILILFWIFVVVIQEKQMQDAASSQVYQTKGEER